MKLLDLIELHQERHENAVLWLFRAGPKSGMTSFTPVPNCFAIEIKDPRLTKQRLEQMLSDYRLMGCLEPAGPHKIINGEHFLPLLVDVDEYGIMAAHCNRADQIHA